MPAAARGTLPNVIKQAPGGGWCRSLGAMPWTWRYLDSEGNPVATPDSGRFATQADAETWLGQEWERLAEDGVAAVALYEDGRMVYGPMSLAPE